MRKDHIEKLKKMLKERGLSENLWHAGPKDLDVLSGDYSVTPDAEGHVFVSPYRSFVSPFLLDSQEKVVDEIEKQIGKRHIKINNTRYSSWGSPDSNNSRKPITIYVDTPEDFEPFEGEAQGWLYRVALSKVADKMKRWKHSVGEFDEYIIPGDVKFDEKIPESVKYKVQKHY